MLMRKLTLTLVLLLTAVLGVKADWAFRNHRFDGFKPLDVNENSIVFLGNSITNMNEWRECFGNDPNILGRGNSGGLAYEWIDFFETVFAGHPKAIFYGLGVNDLRDGRTGAQISADINTFISRCISESPNTQIFIQSIHPQSYNNANNIDANVAKVKETNAAIQAMIEATYGANPKVHFLDFQEKMSNVPYAGEYSYDRLHLTGKSVSIWAHAIAKEAQNAGIELICTLPDPETFNQSDGGVSGNSERMRATHMSTLPVAANDILIVGGEAIHGAEWHEYFANNNVKNRGTKWSAADLSLANHKTQMEQAILGNLHENQTAPAKILFYAGYSDTDDDNFTTNYQALLKATSDRLEALNADNTTEIYAISLLSWNGRSDYASRNAKIQEAVTAAKADGVNVEYVDLTEGMIPAGTMPAEYSIGGYPSGKGYAKMAELLAAKCDITPDAGRTAMTVAKATENVERFGLRNDLATAINAMGALSVGDRPTDLTQEKYDELQILLQDASALLASSPTNAQLQAKIDELNSFEAMSTAAPTEAGWYNIVAVAGQAYSKGFPYVTNTSKVTLFNNNYWTMRFAEYDAANPAKHLVYIDPQENGTLHIQSSSGLYPDNSSVAKAEPSDITVNDGHIGIWEYWTFDTGTENPYVGGKASGNTSKFAYVKADVSGYKIYKVQIIDVVHADNTVSELPNVLWTDPTGERNLGVPTAFNGGYFFVNPEKLLQPDEDLAKLFSTPAINGKMPVIYLDKEGGFNDPEPDPDDENYVAPVHTADEYDLIVIDYSDDNQVLDISELDQPGYYRIQMTMQNGNRNSELITAGQNKVKAPEKYFWQSGYGGNTYGLIVGGTDNDAPATEFIYISKKKDSNHATDGYNYFDVLSLAGHYVSSSGTVYADAALTGANTYANPIKISAVPHIVGKFRIGQDNQDNSRWNITSSDGLNYIGGSNVNNRYELIKVLPEELDQYNIYVVNIASSITKSASSDHILNRVNDVKVSLGYTHTDEDGEEVFTPIQGNMGLNSVYNNGRFFIAKGTELASTHFHVLNATEPEEGKEFHVTIGEKNADGEIPVTITIGDIVTEDDLFSDPNNHADKLITKAGWYKIKAAILSTSTANGEDIIEAGKNWVLNAEDEFMQSASAYYPLKFAAANTELGATNHIYIDPKPTASNQFYIYGLNGHYLDNDVRANRFEGATVGLSITETAEGQPNLFNIGSFWAIYNPNGGSEKPYVGRYNGQNTNRFEIASVADDELAIYNIYKVTIVGGVENTNNIGNNTRVALDIPRNKGIRKVYNGGFFFVEKGDPLTSAEFTPDVIDGKSVAVTIGEAVHNEADGLDYIPVTVTYGDPITGITVSGITTEGSEEATLTKALGLNVPVTVSGTLTSPGTPAIEPAIFGVAEDLSEKGIAVGDFTVDGLNWSVTLTPSQVLTEATEITFTYGRGETPLAAAEKVSVTVRPNAARAVLTLEGLTPTTGSDNIPRYTITAGDPDLKPLYALYDNDAATGTPLDNADNYIDVDFYYNFIGDPVSIEPGTPIEVSQPGVMVISAIVTNPDGSRALVQDLRISITHGEVTGIEVDGIKVEDEDPTAEPSYITETTVSIGETFTVSGKVTPQFALVDNTLFAVEGTNESLALTDIYHESSLWTMTFNPLLPTEVGQPIVLSFKYNKTGVDAATKTVKVNIRPNATTGIISIAETDVKIGDVITPSVAFDVENPHISLSEFTFEPEEAVTVETAADGTVTYTAAKPGQVTVKATATNLNGSYIGIEDLTLNIGYATPTAVTIDSESVPTEPVVLGDSFTLAAATDKENPAYEITYSFDPSDAVEAVTVTDEDGNETTSYVALKAGVVKVTATATDKNNSQIVLNAQPVNVTLVEPEPAEIPKELEEMLKEITDGNKDEIAAIMDEINEALEEGAKIDIDVEDLKGHILMEIEISAEEATTVALPNAATGDAAKELFYKSSDPEIATVDQDGNITALKGGRVFITMQIHLASAPATQMLSLLDEPGEATEPSEPSEPATEPTGKLLATHIYLVSVKENGKIESVEVPSSVSLTPGEETTVDVTVNDGADATQIEWDAPEGVTVTTADDGTSLTIAAGDEDGEYTVTGTYVDAFGKEKTVEIPVTVARKGSVVVGIDEINADINSGRREVYDLQGRRVVGVAKAGIYIIDGKKTFIR